MKISSVTSLEHKFKCCQWWLCWCSVMIACSCCCHVQVAWLLNLLTNHLSSYREDRRRGANAPLQAMVTNGHCGKEASVLLAKMRDTILLGAETNTSRSFSLPIVVSSPRETTWLIINTSIAFNVKQTYHNNLSMYSKGFPGSISSICKRFIINSRKHQTNSRSYGESLFWCSQCK